LLNLREKLVDRAAQNKFTNLVKGNKILRPQFNSIEDIELKLMLVFWVNDLYSERPFWISTTLERLCKVLSMEV
jgi:hypothetical protein